MTLPGSRDLGPDGDRVAELLETTGEPTPDAIAVAIVEVAWPEVLEGPAGDEDSVDDAQVSRRLRLLMTDARDNEVISLSLY